MLLLRACLYMFYVLYHFHTYSLMFEQASMDIDNNVINSCMHHA